MNYFMNYIMKIDNVMLSCFNKIKQVAQYPIFEPLSGYGFTISGCIVILYIFMICIGPKVMKNRKPVDVGIISNIYNIVQIIFNSFITYIGIRYMVANHREHNNLLLMNIPNNPHVMGILQLWGVNKVMDIMDTLFIILKKDSRRLSILHVSHHASVILTAGIYCFLARDHYTATVIITPLMNAVVHVFMYCYYLLSSITPIVKKYKLIITNIQMVQFILIFTHTVIALQFDTTHVAMIMFEMIWSFYMFYMFGKFYVKQLKKSGKS